MIKKIKSKILNIENLTKDTKKFILSVPKSFNFKAGQYVLLEISINNQIQRRAYSIASSPNSETNQIELCIKKVAKKGFVSELFKLKKYSKINILGPVGKFFIDKKPKNNLVFISVGTGIVPFKSMIEYLIKELNFRKEILLISGYRHEKDILYKKFFSDLEKQFPNFKQKVVLSKPNKKLIVKGHVQDVIEKPKFNTSFYICGMKEMISEVAEKLKSFNISNNKIFFEKYD